MNKFFLELKRRSKYIINNDNSILGGINCTGFPKHHFKINMIQEYNMPLQVISVGLDDWKRGCFRYRQKSNTCALEFILSGSLEFEQDNHFYHAKPNSLFIIREHSDSAMYCKEPKTKKYAMILSGRMLPNILAECGLNHIDIIPEVPKGVYELFVAIEELVTKKDLNFEFEVSCLLYRLLLLLAPSKKLEYSELIYKITTYIETNIEYQHSIKDLCKEFCISPSTLHRLFKEHLDDTPTNFVIKSKMTIATKLLTMSEQSIKEIAGQLGYSNQLYFSASFRKFHGISPLKYRKTQSMQSSK